MPFDVVVVADRARIALAAALNILISRKTCSEARFTVAVPQDSQFEHAAAEAVIDKFAAEVVALPAPQFQLDGHRYRIENKINALRYFGSRPVIGVDADVIFIRPLPVEFLFRDVPAAVPEHGLHVYPWEELYSLWGLRMPAIKVLTGSGEVGAPWLNAGLIVCPDGSRFGRAWHRACRVIMHCPWVPERLPYLDQIALPIAMAQLSPHRTVTYDNVLPARFNQNIFYWAQDQNYVGAGYVAHHHYRVQLIEKYLRPLIGWTREEYPIIDELLDGLRAFDDAPRHEPTLEAATSLAGTAVLFHSPERAALVGEPVGLFLDGWARARASVRFRALQAIEAVTVRLWAPPGDAPLKICLRTPGRPEGLAEVPRTVAADLHYPIGVAASGEFSLEIVATDERELSPTDPRLAAYVLGAISFT